MPGKAHKANKVNYEEQIYEAILNGHGVPFEIVTGGVRYKAVLEHKESRERRAATTTTTQNSSTSSPLPGVTRQDPEHSLGGSGKN